MSRARYTGSTAGISEQITETFFGKRSAAFTGNEREVTTWTSGERFGEYRQDRESDDGVGLLGLERSNAFTDMLPAQANGVAAAIRYRAKCQATLVAACRLASVFRRR